VGGKILAEGLCDWKGSVGHALYFNYTLAFCLTTKGNHEKHQSGHFKSIQHVSIVSCQWLDTPHMHQKYCVLHVQKQPPVDDLVSLKHVEQNLTGIN
jgi:hypothetical protein